MWDRLLTNCNVATMDPAVPGAFGMIEDGAVGIQDGRIVRVGRRIDLAGYRAARVEPLGGAWVKTFEGAYSRVTPVVAGGVAVKSAGTSVRAGRTPGRRW